MTRSIWALTPGHAGMENQALGLAEAMAAACDARVAVRRVPVSLPWRVLPGDLWPLPLRAAGAGVLAKPWPDLVITCGRQAAPIGAAMRAHSSGTVRAVHVQNPLMRLSAFDLVVAPEHDRLSGPNVLSTLLAPHRMTAARLAAARAAWAGRLRAPGRRLLAVLIGAPNARGGADDAVRLLDQIGLLARDAAVRLAVTPSRRTPTDLVRGLHARLAGSDAVVWDGTGDNPYVGMLACAEAIVVTEDSMTMVSEALAAGRPVAVAPFGGTRRRLGLFLDALQTRGLVRRFDGAMPDWPAAPVDETADTATHVLARLGWVSSSAGPS